MTLPSSEPPMRLFPLALLLSLSLAAPLSAQSREAPLGDILESIEESTRPTPTPAPAPIQNAPVPPGGIGTTPLPPSRIDTPFGPPTPPSEETGEETEADTLIGDLALDDEEEAEEAPPELTEAERQAQWEAAERVRLEALDRAGRARGRQPARLGGGSSRL